MLGASSVPGRGGAAGVELVRVAQPRCVRAARSSAHLEQALALATPPRGAIAPAHVEVLLPLRNIGQNRTQALVLDHRRLIDPLAPVKDPVGQREALVF